MGYAALGRRSQGHVCLTLQLTLPASSRYSMPASCAISTSPGRRALASTPVPLHVHVYDPPSLPLAPHGQTHCGPVVFIHGLLGSGTNFRTYQLKVAASRRTLAVDLRNHGRSPHVAGPMTLEGLAGDVAAAIEAHFQGGPVDVVGHSLGGKTAMVLGAARPDLVSRLVVVDIAPVAYDTSLEQWRSVEAIIRAAGDLDPSAYRSRSAVDAKLAESVSDAGVRSFIAQNLAPAPDGSYTWRINIPALRASLRNFATFPLKGPTAAPPGGVHFIAGGRSSYITAAQRPAIAALYPGAAVHTVEGAGHWVHADKPAEFWALLSRILDGRD